MLGYIFIPFDAHNNPRKYDISNDILRIYKTFIASSSNNIFYIQPIYSASNAESNVVLHDTIVYSITFIYPTRTAVSVE